MREVKDRGVSVVGKMKESRSGVSSSMSETATLVPCYAGLMKGWEDTWGG